MSTTAAPAPRIDHFFSAVAARLDRWRDLNRAAQTWAANPPSRDPAGLHTACAHTLAILFGRYVLRMNPLILLGACSGAGTVTAALRALEEESHSKLPALGYTVPYAVGNILLTAWGPVIVALMR